MLQLNHKKFKVYVLAIELVEELYGVTQEYPFEEKFNLVQQLRRAAISICSNIAEGASRKSAPDRRRFYEIARSSLVEVDTQIIISKRLKYCQEEKIEKIESHMEEIFRLLSAMIKNLA